MLPVLDITLLKENAQARSFASRLMESVLASYLSVLLTLSALLLGQRWLASVKRLAQMVRGFFLLGVSCALADHSVSSDALHSDWASDSGEVAGSDLADLAFLYGDLFGVRPVHSDRLDAERQATISIDRCMG